MCILEMNFDMGNFWYGSNVTCLRCLRLEGVNINDTLHYCISVCYHPPKPRYSSADLISTFPDNFTEQISLYPNDMFELTGDLNQFNYNTILVDFGLAQIVTEPTRNANILDVFMTNRPDLFNCYVAKSVLKSDHYAVYVNCTSAENSCKKCATAASRKQVKCSKRSGADVARLTRFFNDYNWNGLVLGRPIDGGTLSVNQAFADFDILHYAFDHIVGYSTVTIRERDPSYITP